MSTRPLLKRNRISDLLAALDNLIRQTYLEQTGININTSLITARRLGFTPFGPPVIAEPYIPDGSVVSQFRIEYFPFVETNIKSFLPYNDADSNTEVISQQYFNQQDNVVSINSLEELHRRVINRGRGSTETLTFLDRTMDVIPDLGTKINNFVLTSAQHTINRRNIISDYNFDEFFAKLNRFLAVLEEYRQFSIPNEKLVKRQFDTEIFAKFRTEPTSGQLIIPEDYIGSEPINAIQFLFNPEIDPQGGFATVPQTLPSVITPFNNQVRIEVETLTNTKSGDTSVPIIKSGRTPPFDPADDFEPTRLNQPVIYTDENAFLQNMVVRFLKNYTDSPIDWTLEDSFNLPITPDKNALLFDTVQEIQKDPREILRYTFAIHHIDDTQKGRITKEWSKNLGMVQGVGLEHPSIRLVFLKRKYSVNETIIDPSDITGQYNMGSVDNFPSGSPDLVRFTIQNNTILLPTGTVISPLTQA